MFRDAVLNKEVSSANMQDSTVVESTNEEEDEAIEIANDSILEESQIRDIQQNIESRTTSFPAIHDAYLQNGQGYDQSIVRLEENRRTSYLMFDLSQIDSIGGNITLANLEFVVNTEDGNGKIEVFKGASNEWAEHNLSESSAPEIDIQLGSIEQEYRINEKVNIDLNVADMLPEYTTLILDHKDGNDLAFASKENEEEVGSMLIVTYDAPITSLEIVIDDLQNNEEATEVETPEEENAEETTDTGEQDSIPSNEQSNSPPIAIVSATPSNGVVPLEVTFTGSDSSDDNEIVMYEWIFEDDATSSTANATHTFAEAGAYEVTLKVTDAEGLDSTDTVTITVDERENEAPIASASASVLSGTAPLQISFTGSSSTDDNTIVDYAWDFKDGSSSDEVDPSHTFDSPGTYSVELTVKDEEGLTDQETLTISVDSPVNEAPIAIASANTLNGTAPLEVNFRGEDSSDDNGIISYNWDFPGNPSSTANATYTFDNPGTYDITLRVTDEAGLENTATLMITVDQEIIGNLECNVGGGMANDSGEKIWCWGGITIPEYSGKTGVVFNNDELAIDSECYEKQVTKDGNRLKFRLNPTGPEVGSWCPDDFNKRAEIRTAPWNVRNPIGTEEWFGWSYTFGNDYEIDLSNQWKFFQVHPGPKGLSQQISLEIIHDEQFKDHSAGEVYVVNAGHGTEGRSTDFSPTGFTPRAGQTLDIVVHAIWGDYSNGLLQVWIDGNKVYDKQVATILAGYPWGGNAKWGIYKWPWRDAENVQASLAQGLTQMETFMGPLRMITRKPGDPDYGRDSYSMVAPD